MKVNQNLIRVMSVQSTSYKTHRMERFIKKELQKNNIGYTTDNYGNIYVCKGYADLYPTMVCHIDTVHEINNDAKVVQIDDALLAIDTKDMKRYGIGGDDKVGIYITLELLKEFENFKAVFFLDEEVGCVGSGKADFEFFNDSTIVLECDRRGYNDFVTSITGTTLSDEKLHNDIDHILKKYDRKKTSGGITDVGEIAENNTVQCANMSCGYYDPHSDNEYIIISEVESTKQMCYEILNATKDKRYEIDLDKRISYGVGFSHYHGWDYYDGYYDNSYYGKYHNPNAFDKKNNVLNRSSYGESFKTDAECPCCSSHQVWYDDYEDEFYCLSCQQYVDIDDDNANIDEHYMKNITDKEKVETDAILYDAYCNQNFKKDVEPKYINHANK